jgi:hypothetical protein
MLYNTGLMPLIKDLDGRHMIVTCQFLVLYNFFFGSCFTVGYLALDWLEGGILG